MPKPPISSFRAAAPFWLSLTVVPAVLAAAWWGGWALGLPAAVAWWLFTLLDALAGQNHDNPSTDTDVAELFWYRAITVIWFPVQMAVIFGLIFWARHSAHLAGWEQVVLFLGVGVISGTIDSSASTGGPYSVTVTATDTSAATDSATFTWTVSNPAPLPEMTLR